MINEKKPFGDTDLGQGLAVAAMISALSLPFAIFFSVLAIYSPK